VGGTASSTAERPNCTRSNAPVISLITDGEKDLRLIKLLEQAAQWEGDAGTIYVERPWSSNAEAIIIEPAPDTTDAVGQGGKTYDYFLETFIAQEVLIGLMASLEGTSASSDQICERLISYAVNDA